MVENKYFADGSSSSGSVRAKRAPGRSFRDLSARKGATIFSWERGAGFAGEVKFAVERLRLHPFGPLRLAVLVSLPPRRLR